MYVTVYYVRTCLLNGVNRQNAFLHQSDLSSPPKLERDESN